MKHAQLHGLAIALLLASAGPVLAQDAGGPLPQCEGRSKVFYLSRYESAAPAYPKASLFQVALNADLTASTTEIWSGQGDALPTEPTGPTGQPGATVAMGMNPADGYIYAMRAVGGSDLYVPKEARTEVFKYGAAGVKNLGQLQMGAGLTPVEIADFDSLLTRLRAAGGNFTAADFDSQGSFYVASFQGPGDLRKVFKVDVSTTPPTLTKVVQLSQPIPQGSSGDFTVAADGWAYGIARTATTQQPYRFNVDTGVSESLGPTFNGGVSFGAAAHLTDGSMVQFSAADSSDIANPGLGHLWLMAEDGSFSAGPYLADIGGFSSDGANCLPKPKTPPSGLTPVPTLNAWGLSLLGVLLAAFAFLRRRREV